MRIIAFSSSNKNSASARANSVLPTPVGPRKRNEPSGRFGSCKPARARRTALATALMASSCPTTRRCKCFSSLTSFSRSPSCNRETGICVQFETTSAMSSSVTSSRSNVDCRSFAVFAVAAASFFSSSGMRPYWISLAFASSPRRWARSSSVRSRSSSSFHFRCSSRTAFSFCHSALSAEDFSFNSANSFSSFFRRSLLAGSFSFLSACRSISCCMISRSIMSISVGMESSSIFKRDAASSTRSIALSGRKRSLM